MNFLTAHPLVIGTITTPAGLKYLTAPQVPVDAIELRLDALLAHQVSWPGLEKALEQRQRPVLLTPRAQNEGGLCPWRLLDRRGVTSHLLPLVDALDLELASLRALADLHAEAQERKLTLVYSAHTIEKAATDRQVADWLAKLPLGKSRVLKVASHLRSWRDLQRLAALLVNHPDLPIAAMGLGDYAAQSRRVLLALGSRLAYGYLDAPAAPGQPTAAQVRKMVREVRAGLEE